jgi:hypothetical protein
VERSTTSILGAALGCAVILTACNGGPSKSAALESIQRNVKEDGSCILPLEIMKQLKMQYSSKGVCIPNEGAKAAETCFEALAAAGVTHPKPAKYMVEWEDGATTNDVYDRHARNLVFAACYDMEGGLREGRFPCAEAHADKVVKVTAKGTRAEVLYSRDLAFRPSLVTIEKACGAVTRPPPETKATFTKGASGWTVAAPAPDSSGL